MALFATLACTAYVLSPTAYRAAPAFSVRMQEAAALNIAETASAAVDGVLQMLGDDTEPPKSLLAVKQSVQEGDELEIGAALYLLLVEQALDYDMVEGKMVPTTVDYGNKDDPKVREKLGYIYSYGISMFKKNYIAEDALKDAVLNKVANRVGMDGPAFDQWLAIPAVQ